MVEDHECSGVVGSFWRSMCGMWLYDCVWRTICLVRLKDHDWRTVVSGSSGVRLYKCDWRTGYVMGFNVCDWQTKYGVVQAEDLVWGGLEDCNFRTMRGVRLMDCDW